MSEWQPIKTAPKDGNSIIVFGRPGDIEGVRFLRSGAHTAHWGVIDSAFCLSGGTCGGPFIKPTHWMPLPEASKP